MLQVLLFIWDHESTSRFWLHLPVYSSAISISAIPIYFSSTWWIAVINSLWWNPLVFSAYTIMSQTLTTYPGTVKFIQVLECEKTFQSCDVTHWKRIVFFFFGDSGDTVASQWWCILCFCQDGDLASGRFMTHYLNIPVGSPYWRMEQVGVWLNSPVISPQVYVLI